MIRGVVFDVGETLLHFEGDWGRVFEESRRALISCLASVGADLADEAFSEALRRRIEAAQEVREEDYVERPAQEIIEHTLAEFGMDDLSGSELEQAVAAMFAVSERKWIPVAGVKGILDQVADHGWHLGIISNASDVDNVHRLIAKAGVRSYFDPILVSAGVGVRKPAAAIFEKLLRQWQLPPEATVMIGDTLGADILGAQRVGMQQIWVRTAEDRPDNQALIGKIQPQHSVESLSQVPELLQWMAAAAEGVDG